MADPVRAVIMVMQLSEGRVTVEIEQSPGGSVVMQRIVSGPTGTHMAGQLVIPRSKLLEVALALLVRI